MATGNTPPPDKKQTNKQHPTDGAIENTVNEDNNSQYSSRLQSKQPRFTTTEIIQKFPNVNNRFCQKIGFSVPWDNAETPPNNDTYYTSIRQIFRLIKDYDPQFQILPWNITKQNSNPIVNEEHIPTSPDELKEYIYDLHIQPKRVRAAMVITSAYNLKEILKQQTMATKNSKTLLNKMRQAKIHMKPLNIQTLGEIKLVGFLQFIHPHYSNIKQLLLELQSILETKDITLEIYRPRAISKDNKILEAPEALAIGAPSDISIAVYKSLLEKWKGIHKGEYDIIIGKESLLKTGFFIPFSNSLLNLESRNTAVIAHKEFMKEYTCIHLKRCTSVDIEFTLTKQEAEDMKYIINDDSNEIIITLREIIQCWTEPGSDILLVHTIQNMLGNKKTLLVKKKFKKYIITEILRVLETLEQRKDFNIICGNSEEYGACIDKFTISRSGRSYLSSIRVRKRPPKVNIPDDDNKTIANREKRKRQVLTETSFSSNESSTQSPTYKKGSHHIQTDNSECSNQSTTTMTYSQAAQGRQCDSEEESQQDITIVDSDITKLTTLNLKNTPVQENKIIKPCASSIIPFVETTTTDMTTSTITTEDIITTLQQSNILTTLVDQQIHKVTTAMTIKHENAMKNIQLSHSNQIEQLTNKQTKQESDIDKLKQSQSQQRDSEKKIENKVEAQTNILSSLVTLIQDMKTDNEAEKKRNRKYFQTMHETVPISKISQSDLTDCSYSEGGSSQCSVGSTHSTKSNNCKEPNKNSTTAISTPPGKKNVTTPRSTTSIQCKRHENNIDSSEDNDIRRKTRSHSVTENEHNDTKWKGITSKTKKSTKFHLAIISPSKTSQKKEKHDKHSPNYNKFDPDGTIVTSKSKRHDRDRPSDQQKVLRSGRTI